MERDLRPFVRPVSKGRFRTLLSGYSNFATLNLSTAVMQQKAFTWVDFISSYGQYSLYIYNKVYSVLRVYCLCVYRMVMVSVSVTFIVIVKVKVKVIVNVIVPLGCPAPWCIDISSLAWAGLTLLILIKGQCEGQAKIGRASCRERV